MCLGSSLRKEYLGLHLDAGRSRSQSQVIMTPMTPPCPEVGTDGVRAGTRDAQEPWGALRLSGLRGLGECPTSEASGDRRGRPAV